MQHRPRISVRMSLFSSQAYPSDAISRISGWLVAVRDCCLSCRRYSRRCRRRCCRRWRARCSATQLLHFASSLCTVVSSFPFPRHAPSPLITRLTLLTKATITLGYRNVPFPRARVATRPLHGSLAAAIFFLLFDSWLASPLHRR